MYNGNNLLDLLMQTEAFLFVFIVNAYKIKGRMSNHENVSTSRWKAQCNGF